MATHFNCKCEERSKPILERNWMITEHMWNSCPYVKKGGEYSRWSTVKCFSCKAVGRTRSKYVSKLKLFNSKLKPMRVSSGNIPKFVRYLAVNKNGEVLGFESQPIHDNKGHWITTNTMVHSLGMGRVPDEYTTAIFTFNRSEL